MYFSNAMTRLVRLNPLHCKGDWLTHVSMENGSEEGGEEEDLETDEAGGFQLLPSDNLQKYYRRF